MIDDAINNDQVIEDQAIEVIDDQVIEVIDTDLSKVDDDKQLERNQPKVT